MKAIVLHEFGGPGHLKYEDREDPVAGEGEVLVRVSAASINPVDWKLRTGSLQAYMPLDLPAVLGRDLAGIVRAVGDGVTDFEPGDRVFALANATYAELCVVKASELAKLPEGMDLVNSAALPLVTLTGEQLIRVGTGIQAGETVLIAGALGGVGRSAIRAAKDAGAKVIAGVRHKQLKEAASLGADAVVALDDEDDMAEVGYVDAVADAVGGKTAELLIAKVKPGGVFATVVGAPPANAALNPTIRIVPVRCQPDPATMIKMAEHVHRGELVIPIDRIIALEDAAEGQEAAEKGGIGKVILTN